MKKILTIFIVLLILLTSCRPYEDLSREVREISTWGELFDLYWKRMSTNYLFWEIDYDEGRAWDDVYNEYMPKFSALGNIEGNIEGREIAYSYLYDIIAPLSDGHYTVKINTTGTYSLGNGDSIMFSPSIIREIIRFGYQKEDIIAYFKETATSAKFQEYINSLKETPTNMYMSKILDSMDFTLYSARANSLEVILGYNDTSKILYFGFNEFSFINNIENQDIKRILDLFFRYVATMDLNGIIIDLRGNGGGNSRDLCLIWNVFFPAYTNTIKIAEKKHKLDEGRTSYSPWSDFLVTKDSSVLSDYGHVNRSTPIAVLQNKYSGSCSDMSILFFRVLRDNYGYNVRTFGEASAGATGPLIEAVDLETQTSYPVSEDYYNGGITYDLAPYMTEIYTPYLMMRAYDGNIYEGKGIPADEEIPFDYNAFISNTDNRLNAAINWINKQNQI